MCDQGTFLLFFLLSLVYGVFFVLAITKVRHLVDFSRDWRHSLVFFIVLLVQIALRTIANILLCTCTAHGLFFSFLLFSVPDVLFLAAFLMLIWQLVTVYFFAHLKDSVLDTIERRPKLKHLAEAISATVVAWLALACILYLCLIFGAMTTSELSRAVAIVNICFSAGAIGTLCYLHIKFSGSPILSPRWTTSLHTVTRVSMIWTLGRTISGILQLCNMLGLTLLSENLSENDSYTENFQFAMWLSILLFSEVFCYFLVLDEEFMRIFIDSEGDNLLSRPLSSSIPAPQPPEDELESMQIQQFSGISQLLVEDSSLSRVHGLGCVSNGTYRGKPVAVRRIGFARLTQYVYENLTSEAEALRVLEVSHLLPFIELQVELPQVYLISAYAEKGSLYRALHQDNVLFTSTDKLRVTRELAMCLRDLHNQGWAHGHLSSHNVLLDSNFAVLLSDVGFNSLRKYASVTLQYSNKSSWSSPEQLRDSGQIVMKAKESDDIYSFGMILWELCTEQEPFPGLSRKRLQQMICQEGFRPEIPSQINEELTQLMKSCWNVEPFSRPTFRLVYRSLCQMDS
jgi:hypothetical protein